MDRIYRLLGSLLPERRDRLGRAVAKALRRRRERIPRGMRVFLETKDGRHGAALAFWASAHAPAWEDEARSIPSQAMLDAVRGLILDGRLMEARDGALRRMGLGMDDRPPWSCHAHPMAIRLLRMAGADPSAANFFERGGISLMGTPFAEDDDPMGTLHDFSGALTTSGRYEVKRIKVAMDEGRAISMLVLPEVGGEEQMETLILVHGSTLPDTLVLELPGRRLLDVVELGTGADAALDAALGDLRILQATTNEHGSSFRIAPAEWIPCGPTPEAVAGWNAATTWVA